MVIIERPYLSTKVQSILKKAFLKHKIVADPITFDYHYLTDPVLTDNRVNVTRNVFRANEDSKSSVYCTADSRPNDINIEYTQNGKNTLWKFLL